MEWALSSGQVVKVLFGDPEAGGMSLVWSWFAPSLPVAPPFPQRRLPVLRAPGANCGWAIR